MPSWPFIRNLTLVAMAGGCSSKPPPPLACSPNSEVVCTSRHYDEVSGPVRNPERGLFMVADIFDDGDVEWAAESGASLVNTRIVLDDFRSSSLSEAFLGELDTGFARLRTAGLKAIVRFQYNEGSGEDAPIELVLEHIDQLAPILTDNADVIAVLQAGFIGAWGEWHTSSNGLDNHDDRRAIVEALLAALPEQRMVQLRTPYYKDALAAGGPLDAPRAYSGTALARIGHHNDCLLASDSDEGTYADPIEQWRSYVASDGQYVPVGGEPCAMTNRLSCSGTITELETMNWSFLNAVYPDDVVARWQREGCYQKLDERLGYRLVLTRAAWTEAPSASGSLAFAIELDNRGFAAPFGPREVVLVLDGPEGRHEFALDGADGRFDPRRWLPGDPFTLETELDLAEVAPGSYRMSLWLPDGFASLRGDPAFAIRLANADLWDPDRGDHVLEPELIVAP